MQLNLDLTLPLQKQNPYYNTIYNVSNLLYPYKNLIIWLIILFQLVYHIYSPINISGLTSNDKVALTNLENYQRDKERIILKHVKDTLTFNHSDSFMFLVENKLTLIAAYQWSNLVIVKNKIRYNPDNFPILKEEIEAYRSSNFFGITKHYADNLKTKKNLQFKAAWQNLTTGSFLKAWSSFDSGFQLLVLEKQTILDPSLEKTQVHKSVAEAKAKDLEEQYAFIQQQIWLNKAKSKNKKSSYYSFALSPYTYRSSKSSLSRINRVLQWKEQIEAAANKYSLDPAMVAALIEQESGGNPDALSPAGAIGLMQLMPGTARGLGVNPFDPTQNIDGGAKYFSLQLKRFGNVTDAMIAYNAGPGRVGRMLPEETQKYIVSVPALVDKYRPYFG